MTANAKCSQCETITGFYDSKIKEWRCPAHRMMPKEGLIQELSAAALAEMCRDITQFFAFKKYPKAHSAIAMTFILQKLKNDGVDVIMSVQPSEKPTLVKLQ